MEKVNNEFFNKKEELIINVDESEKIKFGYTEHFLCFTINDVSILPSENTTVSISFEQNGNTLFDIKTNGLITINQRPYEKQYPNFTLSANDNKYIQPNICSGILKIKGSCIVIQTPYYINDH